MPCVVNGSEFGLTLCLEGSSDEESNRVFPGNHNYSLFATGCESRCFTSSWGTRRARVLVDLRVVRLDVARAGQGSIEISATVGLGTSCLSEGFV